MQPNDLSPGLESFMIFLRQRRHSLGSNLKAIIIPGEWYDVLDDALYAYCTATFPPWRYFCDKTFAVQGYENVIMQSIPICRGEEYEEILEWVKN